MTGGNLVLTATPGSLASNTTHFANVSITSADPFVENQQQVRVGLYLSNDAPVSVAPAMAARSAAASPVEPLFAVSVGADVNLQDGRRLWVFGDTLRSADFSGQRFVRNSMLVIDDSCAHAVVPADHGALIPDRPDGIICANETGCVALMAGLRDGGLTIGRDVDVVAKGTSDLLDHTYPAIDSFFEDLTFAGEELARRVTSVDVGHFGCRSGQRETGEARRCGGNVARPEGEQPHSLRSDSRLPWRGSFATVCRGSQAGDGRPFARTGRRIFAAIGHVGQGHPRNQLHSLSQAPAGSYVQGQVKKLPCPLPAA